MNEIFEYDVFISFASQDESIVKPLWQNLSLSGLRVFWSDVTLKQKKVAQNWIDIIQDAVVNSRHFILVCTPNTLSSEWVKDEYQTFYSQCYQKSEGKRLFIIKIENNFNVDSLPPFLKKIQWTDSNEEIIKLLGGTNIDELILENKNLKVKIQKLSEENESLKSSHRSVPEKVKPDKSSKKTTGKTGKHVYLIRRAQLADKPKGQSTGPVFDLGHEFEYDEINQDGWCRIRMDNTDYWLNPSFGVFDDPKIYFKIVEKGITGYLVGRMYHDKSGGDLKYLTVKDNMLGNIDIEIKSIESIKIIDNKESPVELKMNDGTTYSGATTFASYGFGVSSSKSTYLITSSASIKIDTAKNITLERIR